MKLSSFVICAVSLTISSCATGPTGGAIYHNIKYGLNATDNAAATKTGKACQSSILGLVGTGDASISAAKKEGEITEVSSIDASSFSVLYFYNEYCTIVKGK